jgi:hypothetical protein
MPLDIFHRNDIRAHIAAGVLFAVTTTQANGGVNVEYLRGALAMARHQAASFGLSWPSIVSEARASLGAELGGLLDSGVVPE